MARRPRPLDTIKPMLQVEGAHGLEKLRAKAKTGGVGVLFHGAGGLVSQALWATTAGTAPQPCGSEAADAADSFWDAPS